jgi:hypothetical protein
MVGVGQQAWISKATAENLLTNFNTVFLEAGYTVCHCTDAGGLVLDSSGLMRHLLEEKGDNMTGKPALVRSDHTSPEVQGVLDVWEGSE